MNNTALDTWFNEEYGTSSKRTLDATDHNPQHYVTINSLFSTFPLSSISSASMFMIPCK